MAARKSGTDTYNTGPISYLDDVPFRLNDKFRCPAKVGLPIGFCLPDCGTVMADMQYDFSLERRTVRWGEELARARAAEAEAAEAAAAAATNGQSEQEAQASSAQDSDGGLAGGKRARPSDEHELPPPALNPVLAGLSHNAILTPLPAPSIGATNASSQPPHPSHGLNLADFEREEDPFDKLELKTLDDKEELRSILQAQPQSEPAVPAPAPAPGPAPAPAPDPRRSCTPPLQSKAGLYHKPNGLVALLDLERVAAGGVSGFGRMDPDRPCNIRSLTFPKLSDPGDSPTDANPFHSGYMSAPPRPGMTNGNPPALQRTVPSSHSHNALPQEPATYMHTHTQNNGTPKQCAPVSGPPPGSLPCGGALLSLSPAERQCVETIVSMGYSYEGVIKAMQRQGQNVEQVLDYMFIHTRLCERGFDASAVEECLEMYQCSEEKALEFLQLMSRFGEMGFERDTIKEVLLVHNNDQDKALEDLMARAATAS
ncbi:ubiquitin-associated protein 1 [Sardina pilchardus]|uniref:ubiquitin-associated protein 1 n=1 Tax=Sardina pilchardus TaxID=27697 RepID=UPI002E1518E2